MYPPKLHNRDYDASLQTVNPHTTTAPTTMAKTSFQSFVTHVTTDPKSLKILIFALLNLSFMFVEVLVGFWSNSLGLISDAGHMLFDCTALFIGLFAAFAASWRADRRFTYGYARYEVLSGFVNGVFLIFVAFAVLTESLSRISEPPEVHSGHLLWTSITGLFINMVGLVFFHDFSHGGNHEHCNHGHGGGHDDHQHHGHSHGDGGTCNHGSGGEVVTLGAEGPVSDHDQNMRGIFLHILADALGSVGVVISSAAIKYFGWYMADPICSLMISVLILMSVVPLIQDTSKILLQQIPDNKAATFASTLVDISRFKSVEKITDPHFWSVRGGLFVTTLHVTVDPTTTSARQQQLLNEIVHKLKSIGANHTTVQITKRGCGTGGGGGNGNGSPALHDLTRRRVEAEIV